MEYPQDNGPPAAVGQCERGAVGAGSAPVPV